MNTAAFALSPLLLLLLTAFQVPSALGSTAEFSRGDFPADFVFGAGTSSYQYEGAVAEDGKGPSILDTFAHQGRMPYKSTGDVAADGYHKYKEDVKLMRDVGLEAYRFSISWPRLIPNGRGEINPEGLKYYNNVIDELLANGIQPHVTLYHFDLPQALEDEYEGWLSSKIVDDFRAYADVCFRLFGDRISHWTTINQPNILSFSGYDSGQFAPGRCSRPFGFWDCPTGNSTSEPYIALHNMLLAHASAVELYKTKYQGEQEGVIGLNAYTFWFEPYANSSADLEASQRAFDFLVGWVLNPVFYGDYPSSMRDIVASRLPIFTEAQSELLKGSFDFIGLNHYQTLYISNLERVNSDLRDLNADMAVEFAGSRNESAHGQYVPDGNHVEFDGLKNLLERLRREYENPAVYIHENGFATPPHVTLEDNARIDAVTGYIGALLAATRTGANVKGYFIWSLVDVFEFTSGYQSQFGIFHVDFGSMDRKRTPKNSAGWYRDFLKNNKRVTIVKTKVIQPMHSSK